MDVIGRGGFLSPTGEYYSLSDYEKKIKKYDHNGLAQYIIEDILKINDNLSCTFKSYLVSKGWVAVRYHIDNGICITLTYDSRFTNFNTNPIFMEKMQEYFNSGAKDGDINRRTLILGEN